jgi:endoglucanase
VPAPPPPPGPGVQLMLYKLTKDTKYADGFNRYMAAWQARPKTPKGLAFFIEWGPNRYATNTAFLALVAADNGLNPAAYRKFAKSQVSAGAALASNPRRLAPPLTDPDVSSQVHYVLGDCCGGVDPATKQPQFSYVIGYGNDYPRAPHHRAASCDKGQCLCSTDRHPHTLYGAMVGGPNLDDSYTDDCQDYQHNEVATDYNAGLTGAVAGLKHLSITGQLGSV